MFDLLLLQELLSDEMTEPYRAQLKIVDRYSQQIIDAFSEDFLDDYWAEISQLAAIQEDHAFLQGLRLGAQLTLALLIPPARSRTPRP